MDAIWGQLALVAGLIVLNAAFAGSEIALITLRDSQLARLAEHGRAGRTLDRLARDPNRFLATIQIGITLAGFLASATAAVTLSEPLVEALGALGNAARPVAIMLVTLALTFVTLVIGELAPKRVAMQRAERWGLVVARPLAFLATVTRPVVWLLGVSTDLVVRLFGGDPDLQREEVSEEELRDMVAAQPELSDQERAIIAGAFELADRTLRQILVPRVHVLAFPQELPSSEAIDQLVRAGHSRAPVHRGDLDDVVGIVHLRGLVDQEGTVGELAQPALIFPEALGALDALRTLQAQRQQLALVVNEHGGTEGVITIEDLVEELVGEIWDEADPDVAAVEHDRDGSLTLTGAYPIHDLDDIGVSLEPGDYTTVAGFILERMGRLPVAGDELVVDGWRLEVLEATDRTIAKVRLVPLTEDPAAPPESPRD